MGDGRWAMGDGRWAMGDGREGVYFGHGMGRDVRRLRSFEGDRGVAGWSKIERGASQRLTRLPQSLPKPITPQQIPTSEIMSDEMLSN